MNTLTGPSLPIELAPVPAHQRIEALDAVRGFALIGICLMNVEFFNRSIHSVGQGMQSGLTGVDWLAAFFASYFVTGKFWTIFALLFGMGFAVMLTRAEAAGRDFLKPYLRRIAALAVFGAIHHIVIWPGDILFSYAVGAIFLLLALYGTWQWMLGAIVVLAGLALIPGLAAAGRTAGTLAFAGLVALYLRNQRRIFSLPVMSLLLLATGGLLGIAAAVMWIFKVGPAEAALPLSALSPLLLLVAFLSSKYHAPVEARPWRAGAAIYLFSFTMMTIGGAYDYLVPPKPEAPVAAAPAKAIGGKQAEATDAEKAAERKAERAKRLKESADAVANEVKVLTTGTYAEAFAMRASHFAERAPQEAGFANILIAMFLIGTWFIRSGVMQNTGAHLPLFRKLAYVGLPFGIGLGLLGSLITTSHVPGAEQDGFQFARGLLMLGNLPASLGYVGMIVLMLHSSSGWSKVRILAPFGRVALTNYLAQSVIASMFFFNYGLGNWGLGRAWQLVFALGLCAFQIALSHWWLARFRYGPVEWLWRAITYMKIPAMRVDTGPGKLQAQPTL
jgi:uncharacterized protein